MTKTNSYFQKRGGNALENFVASKIRWNIDRKNSYKYCESNLSKCLYTIHIWTNSDKCWNVHNPDWLCKKKYAIQYGTSAYEKKKKTCCTKRWKRTNRCMWQKSELGIRTDLVYFWPESSCQNLQHSTFKIKMKLLKPTTNKTAQPKKNGTTPSSKGEDSTPQETTARLQQQMFKGIQNKSKKEKTHKQTKQQTNKQQQQQQKREKPSHATVNYLISNPVCILWSGINVSAKT